MALRALALVAATVALLALPASAHATPPWACLSGSGAFWAPVEGQPVSFDASCSGDADDYDYDPDDRDIVLFEWDLDGDGAYETSTGVSPLLTHTWSDRTAFLDAELEIGLRVTDSDGEQAATRLRIWIVDAVNSWFEFDPELANPGDTLTFDAYPIRKPPPSTRTYTYSWDLDGDGSYEHATGSTPQATLVVPDPFGKRSVGLRVVDDLGNVSRIRREVEALPRHPSRDLIPWNAPPNLAATVGPAAAPGDAGTVAPVGPDMPAVEPDARPAPQPRRPRLAALDANRNGLSIRYTDGPKWSRWKLVVRRPADRAAEYGLPRRTVVFARGTLNFNGRGVATAKMRWTKGAYRVFRRVRYGVVDIRARRIA